MIRNSLIIATKVFYYSLYIGPVPRINATEDVTVGVDRVVPKSAAKLEEIAVRNTNLAMVSL